MSLDYTKPQKYIGPYRSCYLGYSNSELIRDGAASGGVVSAALLYMLHHGMIDGAMVSKQVMINNEISYRTFIATTEEEILDCRTSIYMDFPLVKHFKEILAFQGKLALVALPCQLKILKKMEESHPGLKEKIVLRIGLFCSGSPSKELVYKVLQKNKIPNKNIERIYFRKGHWRGQTLIKMKDGSEKTFSYLYNLCTYKNLYFYSLPRCFSCQDHFAFNSDISCGDVWLKEMKKEPIKHTGVIVKNQAALDLVLQMIKDKALTMKKVEGSKIIKSQKRALIYKFNTALARKRIGKFFGLENRAEVLEGTHWNHYLAAVLVILNIKLSRSIYNKLIFLIPRRLLFLYMGFIRTLLNF